MSVPRNEEAMHAIARELCRLHNRKAHYDPTDSKHDHWRWKACRILWLLDMVENGGCHDFPLRRAA